jgi:TatA/E family protein of Tat protein translocase
VFNIGPLELMVILVIALLVVGPKRLPEVGRSIGKGLREFRRAQDEVTRTIRMGIDDDVTDDAGGTPPAEGGAGTVTSAVEASAGSAPAAEDDAADAVRTLGRSLAELRRAREELQRSFRVDLNGPQPRPRPTRPTPAASASPEPPAEPQPPTGPPADPD